MHTRIHKQQKKKALEAYLQAPASQNTWVIHDNARLGIFCFQSNKVQALSRKSVHMEVVRSEPPPLFTVRQGFTHQVVIVFHFNQKL